MSEVVLKARGLTKRFHEGRLDLTVLHGIDLDVHAGETLARHGIHVRRFEAERRWLRFGLPGDVTAFDRLADALATR